MRYHAASLGVRMERPALKLTGLTAPARAGAAGGLNGLTLAPAPGEITVLLGPPGSGKSAAIEAAAGAVEVGGTIEWDGKPVRAGAVNRRMAGVVSRAETLLPAKTLGENVAFPLRVHGMKGPPHQLLAAELLSLMQLADTAHLLPAQASAAQCQRALLARAAVLAPGLLLLDEPFSAQPAGERPGLFAVLRQLHTFLGTTTLLALADGNDALAAADRIAVLQAGTVAQYGTAEDVYNRPHDAFTARLLGETNLLPGRVASAEDDIATIKLACGPSVEAGAGERIQPGDSCLLALRPDRIAIVAASAAEMGGEAIDATLIEARFEGATYRMRLLIGTGAEIVVRRAAAAGLRGLNVGARVSLAWQPHHAIAFGESRQ